MLPTSARLLQLLTLLQARRFWSGAELAERLEITERTVRRDMDRLRSLGYPVHATSGVAGGYQLGAGSSLPPLLLDDDEALVVALGLRSTAVNTVTGMEEASVRALAKLEQVLPARLKRRVKALYASVVPLLFGGPSVDADLLTSLASACRNRDVVTFGYVDRTRETSRRTIEPHGVVSSGSRWYLVAWDLDRDDWRIFRIDRIHPPLSERGSFSPRPLPDRDLAAYVSRSISTEVYVHRARFVLHASVEEVARRISPLAGHLTPLDRERCLLEVGGQTLEMLPLYVASFGVDFEVLEPPELLDSLQTLAARLARAAQAGRKNRRRSQLRRS